MRYLMIVKMSEFIETSLEMQLMRYLMIVKMNEFLETSVKNAALDIPYDPPRLVHAGIITRCIFAHILGTVAPISLYLCPRVNDGRGKFSALRSVESPHKREGKSPE